MPLSPTGKRPLVRLLLYLLSSPISRSPVRPDLPVHRQSGPPPQPLPGDPCATGGNRTLLHPQRGLPHRAPHAPQRHRLRLLRHSCRHPTARSFQYAAQYLTINLCDKFRARWPLRFSQDARHLILNRRLGPPEFSSNRLVRPACQDEQRDPLFRQRQPPLLQPQLAPQGNFIERSRHTPHDARPTLRQ